MRSCICESGNQIEARHAHGCPKDMSRIENVRRVVREELLASNPTEVETVKVSELLGAGNSYPEPKSNITVLAAEPLPEGAQLMNTPGLDTKTAKMTIEVSVLVIPPVELAQKLRSLKVLVRRDGDSSIINGACMDIDRWIKQLERDTPLAEPKEFGRKVIATVGSYNGVFMTDGRGTWIEVGDSFDGTKFSWSNFINPRVEKIQ